GLPAPPPPLLNCPAVKSHHIKAWPLVPGLRIPAVPLVVNGSECKCAVLYVSDVLLLWMSTPVCVRQWGREHRCVCDFTVMIGCECSVCVCARVCVWVRERERRCVCVFCV